MTPDAFPSTGAVNFDGNNPWAQLPFGLTATFDVTPVPEPTTVISGILMVIPFGASTLRILGKNRTT